MSRLTMRYIRWDKPLWFNWLPSNDTTLICYSHELLKTFKNLVNTTSLTHCWLKLSYFISPYETNNVVTKKATFAHSRWILFFSVSSFAFVWFSLNSMSWLQDSAFVFQCLSWIEMWTVKFMTPHLENCWRRVNHQY